jgi:hypothetical protein
MSLTPAEIDAIEWRIGSNGDTEHTLENGDARRLIAEVRRLRRPKGIDPVASSPIGRRLDAARAVVQLWVTSPDFVSIEPPDYGDELMHALFGLVEVFGKTADYPESDDPWTIHGEAQATLRADGEREERR